MIPCPVCITHNDDGVMCEYDDGRQQCDRCGFTVLGWKDLALQSVEMLQRQADENAALMSLSADKEGRHGHHRQHRLAA